MPLIDQFLSFLVVAPALIKIHRDSGVGEVVGPYLKATCHQMQLVIICVFIIGAGDYLPT